MSLLYCPDQPWSPETTAKSGQQPQTAATVLWSEGGLPEVKNCKRLLGFEELVETKLLAQERRSSEVGVAHTRRPKIAGRWAAAAAAYFGNREPFPAELGVATTWVL